MVCQDAGSNYTKRNVYTYKGKDVLEKATISQSPYCLSNDKSLEESSGEKGGLFRVQTKERD